MGRLSRPILHIERLRLEPLAAAHLEPLVELDSDPLVLRHVFGRALTRDEVVGTWLPRRTRRDADARGIGYGPRRTPWGHGYAAVRRCRRGRHPRRDDLPPDRARPRPHAARDDQPAVAVPAGDRLGLANRVCVLPAHRPVAAIGAALLGDDRRVVR